MANLCTNYLWIIAREDDVRSVLVKMADNLSAAGEGSLLRGLGEESSIRELTGALRLAFDQPVYLYALSEAPEHRHMGSSAGLSTSFYATGWWRLQLRFTTDWGSADSELAEFYTSLEGVELGWLTGFQPEGQGLVVPGVRSEVDSRFEGYGSVDDRFCASYYHRQTGEVPPPDKSYVTSLARSGDVADLEWVASAHRIGMLLEGLDPKELYKKGQYEAFTFVLANRRSTYRLTNPAPYLIDAATRGDDRTVEALVEHVRWTPRSLSIAEAEVHEELEGEALSLAEDALLCAQEKWARPKGKK